MKPVDGKLRVVRPTRAGSHGFVQVRRVRLLDRALDQLDVQIRSAGIRSVVGLLLGRLDGEVAWIEKILPCPHAQEDPDGKSFRIDPQVVRNVRGALEGKVISLVGSYEAFAASRDGEEVHRVEMPPAEVGPLWLRARSDVAGVQAGRISVADLTNGGQEIEIEVVRPVARPLATCPE